MTRIHLFLPLLVLLTACRAEPGALVDVTPPELSRLEPRSAARLEHLLTQSHATMASSMPREQLSTEALLELGHACLARGIGDCALDAYTNATTLAPTQPSSWLFRAQAEVSTQRPLEAVTSLERALALDTSDDVARLRLAEALVAANEPTRASTELQRLLSGKALPETLRAQALYTLAQIQIEADPTAALASLDQAIALAPRASLIERSRAESLRRLGRADEAEAALARSGNRAVPVDDPIARTLALEKRRAAFDGLIDLAATPAGQDPEVLLGFADAQFGENRNAVLELEHHLRDAGELTPAIESRLLWVQGVLHQRLGAYLEARGRFSRAAELDPSLIPARTRLAATHFQLGDGEAALGVLAEVLASGRDTIAALDLRSQVWLAGGRLAEAERDLRQALELDPRQGSLRLRLAELAERTGRSQQAIVLYESALELTASSRDRALALYRLARLRASSGDLAKVEADLRRATTLDPTFLDPQLALGGLLLETGRFDDAIAVWRRASLLVPDSPVPHRAEAATLLTAQRWSEATTRLDQALERFPDDPALLATLARHLAACPELAERRGARALELARRVSTLEPSPANRETVAMALAETGDFAGAAREQQRLIDELGPRAGSRAAALRANLERYRRSERCCS